ncbi:hypothetical protein BYT27DRAFT_7186941 [Phlegmacium glaucopus]|nr:hypothetical protein BYT27DRAFT_7186941 [Phlegmacium glaucopus]
MKRKLDSNDEQENAGKRVKLIRGPQASTSNPLPLPRMDDADEGIKSKDNKHKDRSSKPHNQGKGHQRRRINKLVPPRPFPTVPTSVSATGPRSSHREGKNLICITRKTPLANYLRRCKTVIIEDGYKTLHLSAMGAAIPHLLQLVCALPPILPFPQDEIHTEVTTGTVEVQDEVLPQNDDDDITYETRGKSTLRIIFKIGDGTNEGDKIGSRKYAGGKGAGKGPPRNVGKKGKGKARTSDDPSEIVFEEPEQEYMDML